MKTLMFTAVITEINKVTSISIEHNYKVYTDFFTKKVSLFYVENNHNIFIDTIVITHSNYKEFTDKVEKYVLIFLGKKANDYDTISPLFVTH